MIKIENNLPLGRLNIMSKWKIAQHAELKWWKSYLRDKDPVEYLNWKTSYWRDFLKAIGVDIADGQAIIDAGCGPAGIFTILDQCEVDAVDPLLGAYEKWLKIFSPSQYPWVRFHEETLEAYVPNQVFDIAFCLNVINHVKDFDRSIDKLISMTREGGMMVMSIDAHNWQFFRLLFRLLPLDILHPHQYSLKEYENALAEKGLTIERSVKIKSGFLFDYYCLVASLNKPD